MHKEKIYKIKKGKRIFHARVDMILNDSEYIGLQCYKDGEYIYSKWSNLKTLKFYKHEIIETFECEVVE